MLQFICFQPVNASKNVSVPIDGIDAVALGSGDEGQMNSNSSGTFIGACEQRIFSYENPAFDGTLTFIIVYSNIGVFEKSSQRPPVVECVIDRFHQLVSGVELLFCADNDISKALYERFRFSAPHCQSERCGFVLYVPLDCVESPVHVENGVANICLSEFRLEIFTPGVSMAACFDSLAVLEQCVKSAGCICLDDAFEIFEKFEVLVEGQIGRIVKHRDIAMCADVGRNFALANVVLVLAVLDLDGGVIGFDDIRREQLSFHQVIQKAESVGSSLHPVALSGARNSDVMTGEDFLLAIVGKTVVEFADNYFSQKARTGVAARDGGAGLFGGGDVLLAARASAGLLQMIENLQAGAYHFELVGKQVANGHSFDGTVWAEHVFRFDRMLHGFVRQIFGIFEDMFDTRRFAFLSCLVSSSSFCPADCGARIVFFGLFAVVALVAFFGLGNQDIQFLLQVFKQLALFFTANQGLFQLFSKLSDRVVQFRDVRQQVGVFLLQSRDFLAV